MGYKKKEYVGGINTEVEAARIYDEMSIKSNGLKVIHEFVNKVLM